jgi:hypothetical protein
MVCPIAKILFFTSKTKFFSWLEKQGCEEMAEYMKKYKWVSHGFSANSVICRQACKKYPCQKNSKAFCIASSHPTLDDVAHEIVHALGEMSHGIAFSKLLGELWEHLRNCNDCKKRFGNLPQDEWADPWLPTQEEMEELKKDKSLPYLEKNLEKMMKKL